MEEGGSDAAQLFSLAADLALARELRREGRIAPYQRAIGPKGTRPIQGGVIICRGGGNITKGSTPHGQNP
ncbi:hypothetical protein [Cohaesibacter marisflavi]|uniref:hypothetical protein n=1 Tax=Cohaesibacter marisflavi TaxID=655353 RepID=UPI0029C71FB3|nr:hypothetical protein [Cohaesibacter marisflavi]